MQDKNTVIAYTRSRLEQILNSLMVELGHIHFNVCVRADTAEKLRSYATDALETSEKSMTGIDQTIAELAFMLEEIDG